MGPRSRWRQIDWDWHDDLAMPSPASLIAPMSAAIQIDVATQKQWESRTKRRLIPINCGSYGCGAGLPGSRANRQAGEQPDVLGSDIHGGQLHRLGTIGTTSLSGSTWAATKPWCGLPWAAPTISPITTEPCVDDSTVVDIQINDRRDRMYGYQFQVNYRRSAGGAANPGTFVNSWFDTNGNGLVPPAVPPVGPAFAAEGSARLRRPRQTQIRAGQSAARAR